MECTPELIDRLIHIVEDMLRYHDFNKYFPQDVADEMSYIALTQGYAPIDAPSFWEEVLKRPEKEILIREAEKFL